MTTRWHSPRRCCADFRRTTRGPWSSHAPASVSCGSYRYPTGGSTISSPMTILSDLVRERMVIGEEIVEPPVGYLYEPQETDAGACELQGPRVVRLKSAQHRRGECHRVVIRRIPARSVGDVEVGAVYHTGSVCQTHEVIELRPRQVTDRYRAPADGNRGDELPSGEHLPEQPHVILSDLFPYYLAAERIGVFAHLLHALGILEQADDPAGKAVRVAEVGENPSPIGEQFLRVVIRSRHYRLAEPDGVGKRPAHYLVLLQVRGHVYVAARQELGQLFKGDEAVVEDDVFLDAQLVGPPLQEEPVLLALLRFHGRMGRAENSIDDVGKSCDYFRHRLDHVLDALPLAEQAEGQQDRPALEAPLHLVIIGIAERHVGDTVVYQVHLLGVNAVASLEELYRLAAHDHQRIRELGDFNKRLAPLGLRVGRNGVDGRYDWLFQVPQEVRYVYAPGTTENPELVL